MAEQQTQKPLAGVNLDEVTVEIADECNRNVVFPPNKETLRGRWSSTVLKGVTARQPLLEMPDIPGVHIQIDPRRRAARIYDPLGLPENAELVRRINAQYKKLNSGVDGRPADEKRHTGMTDTQIKTWLYWVARLVEAKTARGVHGTLPSFAEIEKLPGKTEFGFYHESRKKVRFREDVDNAVLEPVG